LAFPCTVQLGSKGGLGKASREGGKRLTSFRGVRRAHAGRFGGGHDAGGVLMLKERGYERERRPRETGTTLRPRTNAYQ